MKTTINFEQDGKPKTFVVKHNLHEFGLDIHAAFVNWSVRTTKYTVKDFCKYVVSKDIINLKCKPVK